MLSIKDFRQNFVSTQFELWQTIIIIWLSIENEVSTHTVFSQSMRKLDVYTFSTWGIESQSIAEAKCIRPTEMFCFFRIGLFKAYWWLKPDSECLNDIAKCSADAKLSILSAESESVDELSYTMSKHSQVNLRRTQFMHLLLS